jgi:hypothetical protein
MKLRLITDFLRKGEVLGIGIGTAFADIEKHLGEPSSVDPINIGTEMYYGGIRILSSDREGGVWFIEIEGASRKGPQKFYGNKALQLVSEGLLPGLTRTETIRLLGEHGLKAVIRQPKRSIPRPEGDHAEWCYLELPSGVMITFERFGIFNPTSEYRLLKLNIGKYREAGLKPLVDKH